MDLAGRSAAETESRRRSAQSIPEGAGARARPPVGEAAARQDARDSMNVDRLLIGAFLVLITALTFYFPGHTWLQADTQIYAAMLEHLDPPDALSRAFVVARSRLAFPPYDVIALPLH